MDFLAELFAFGAGIYSVADDVAEYPNHGPSCPGDVLANEDVDVLEAFVLHFLNSVDDFGILF